MLEIEKDLIVDVILPNYNKVNFIEECLTSLTNQIFKNWRCIVVDGFSDDGSWEIIQKFTHNDSRFDLYQIPRKGIYNSWNFGLSKVTSPFFCILTSDDLWDSNWLSIAVKTLIETDSAICVAARTKIIYENEIKNKISQHNLIGEIFFETDLSKPQIRQGIADSIANYFLGSIYTSIHSLLIRKTILNKGEAFSEDVGAIADCEWYMRLGLYGDVVYCPNVEVGWRVYDGQATNPQKQRENGQYMQIIHTRSRNDIVKKMNIIDHKFNDMASQFDSRLLTYRYSRPCLKNLYSNFVQELPNLLLCISKFPKEFLLDIVFKISGKDFFIEKSLLIAKQVLD
jgi:glycosyltransferase involved in cell wall biosynthesis